MRSLPLFAAFAMLVCTAPAGSQQPASAQGTTLNDGRFPFAGLYRITQHNKAGSCAPRPLPPPERSTPADTEYFTASTLAPSTNQFWVRHTQDGNRLTTAIHMDSLQRDTVPQFTGTARPDGSWSIGRTLALGPEGGPRKGGHRLFVEQTMNVRGAHKRTPTGVKETATGKAEYRFRLDSANGAVFTTCTVTFTATGTRVAF